MSGPVIDAARAGSRRRDLPDRAARAALSCVVEPADEAVARLVARDGAEATWRAILAGAGEVGRREVLRRRAERVDGGEVLAHARRLGIGYVCPGEEGWPEVLDAMAETLVAGADAVPPPFGLWVRGEVGLCEAAASAVAVVGARNATRYGERVASDLASDLAATGWTVVSGAAFGVDAAAHRGALALGGLTVAVLAGGVDVAYPRGHSSLLGRIAASGAVVSEAPPGARPMRSRFLARNRLIAGLSAGTVVVEAASRSGALSTALWAAKLSREVMAVPGPVTSELSAGCHKLVRDKGAVMVTDAGEVLDAVRMWGGAGVLTTGAGTAGLGETGQRRPIDELPADQLTVREAMLADAPSTIDMLSAATGLRPSAVRTALSALESGGWVAQQPGGWRLGRDRGSSAWRA